MWRSHLAVARLENASTGLQGLCSKVSSRIVLHLAVFLRNARETQAKGPGPQGSGLSEAIYPGARGPVLHSLRCTERRTTARLPALDLLCCAHRGARTRCLKRWLLIFTGHEMRSMQRLQVRRRSTTIIGGCCCQVGAAAFSFAQLAQVLVPFTLPLEERWNATGVVAPD